MNLNGGGSGIIYLNFWYVSTTGNNGGFNGPTANLICTIFNPLTQQKYGCFISCYNTLAATGNIYTGYQITTY